MRRAALAVLLLVPVLAGCAPKGERREAICAIQALPARPGFDRFGAPPPGVEKLAQATAEVYGPGIAGGYGVRWWGPCGPSAKSTDMLLLGPAPWALTKGGPRTDGHQVAYGTCYHRREADSWRTVACRINR